MSTDMSVHSFGTQMTNVGSSAKDYEVSRAERQEVSSPPAMSLKELKLAELKGEPISISGEQLVKVIERSIKAIEGPMTSLDFSIHKQTNQIMVKVLNKETGELIREIPPEKTLDFVAKMREMAGILIDERR